MVERIAIDRSRAFGCHTAFFRPNYMHMVLISNHVNLLQAISSIAIADSKYVTNKMIDYKSKGLTKKGQYWVSCHLMSLLMIYSWAAVTLTFSIMQTITVYHFQEVVLISLKIRYIKRLFLSWNGSEKSLVANPVKLQTMLVKSNNIKDIKLNVSLPSSDTMKVLGIDINDRLIFDGYVSNMCIKVLQRLKGSLN